MPDREKIIKGLELCTNISQDGCLMLCPYKDEKDETYSGFCEQVLKQDVLALLKEQETRTIPLDEAVARVISLDEAMGGNNCYYVEFRYHPDCGWVKCDFDMLHLNGEVAMLFSREKTFYQQAEHYGILWRLWNKRPTYVQRDGMKWGSIVHIVDRRLSGNDNRTLWLRHKKICKRI